MYLIFGVIGLLCMQAIHANRSNNCEDEVKDLQTDAKKFFGDFKPVYDKSNADVISIQTLSGMLDDGLSVFTSKNYGDGLTADHQLSDVAVFTTGFYLIEPEVWTLVHRIEQKSFELRERIRCFRLKNNLKCQRRRSSSPCEAELNKLRCDLDEFFDGVDRGFDKALRNLDSLLNAFKTLSRLTRNFSTNNDISCGPPCSSSGRELQRNIRNFITLFNPQNNIIVEKIKSVASDWNAVVISIKKWPAQL